MFTGIVAGVGKIAAVAPKGDGLRLVVAPGALDIADVEIGDSVAVNGCCLTVAAKSGATLGFDVSAETLACTAGLDGAADVNLEKSLRLSDRLGGHLVSGHVDGVGTVTALERVDEVASGTGSWRLDVDAPAALARFIAVKGSIAVNGVSLTVNGVDGTRFHVNLIPHTLGVTTLKASKAGAKVNLEVDLVARYLERLAEFPRA
ncbi:MAG: riboflavin synthase [Casimicrobiaceae bacterium]